MATVLSNDNDCSPEIPAMLGSSIALCVSEIPFAGPTGSVVVGLVDGELVLNPTVAEREKSDLHLTVAGTKDAIMMVEAGANEVPEEKMLQAILYAHEEIKKLVAFQEGIVAEIGKEKREFPLVTVSDEVAKAVREFAFDKVVWALTPLTAPSAPRAKTRSSRRRSSTLQSSSPTARARSATRSMR